MMAKWISDRKRGPVVWFIGPFPPPLSGQSNYNDILLKRLNEKLDVRGLITGCTPVEKILCAIRNPLIILFRIKRMDTVYTSAPGQLGLWLFLLTVIALRLRGLEHFLHHHSYRAINLAPTASHRWLARLGGVKQRHVFLCEGMLRGYADHYLSATQRARALVVPNAFLFADGIDAVPQRSGPIVIGHLSVMTLAKGVDYILELLRRLADLDGVEFVLAGPIADDALRSKVEAAVAEYPGRLRWIGPVQGECKAAFYRRTDIFVLPSRLIDEADPLVILEAYAAGATVLASNRGCIADRILEPGHLMTMEPDCDSCLIRELAVKIAGDRFGWARRSQDHAKLLFALAEAQGTAFMTELGMPRLHRAPEL